MQQIASTAENERREVEVVLRLTDVTHRYGAMVALVDVSLLAHAGEFVTILGESGSGKTTLLKLISGMEQPSEIKTFELSGIDVHDVPANLRDCATVFQSYALFPHMSVGQNVEYGLKVRNVPASQRRKQALEALEMVQLGDKYDRMIHQLSGGQRQRVALARAIILRPKILLLDEPLGALDERLRVDMQTELMALQRSLGMTFIYITHSQEEALTMSDRILLLREGRIAQEGTPVEMFDRPNSEFVARFMGVENILRGNLVSLDSQGVARVQVGDHLFEGVWSGAERPVEGQTVAFAIRAERIRLSSEPLASDPVNAITVGQIEAVYKGKYQDLTASTAAGPLKVRLWDAAALEESARTAKWRAEDCSVTSLR